MKIRVLCMLSSSLACFTLLASFAFSGVRASGGVAPAGVDDLFNLPVMLALLFSSQPHRNDLYLPILKRY